MMEPDTSGLVPGISRHRFRRGGRMDTRNKSGYDGGACPEPVEGGRSDMTEEPVLSLSKGAFGHDGGAHA